MRKFAIPFLDVMTLLVLVLLLLLFAAMMKISDATPTKATVNVESRYIVTLTWHDGSANDVDLWVLTPDGPVGFNTRQNGFVSLDHDDLGQSANSIVGDDGQVVVVEHRQEVIYFRQTLPNVTYVINVHLYRQTDTAPEPVVVTLVETEPHWREVTQRTLTLTAPREEHTAFRFTTDAAGRVITTDTVEELFVENKLSAR